MRKWLVYLGMLGVLAFGVTGCGTLTDALNQRSQTEASAEDLRLQQDVLNRLQQDPVTARHSVAVESRDGRVAVYGTVPDDMTRHRILNVVRGTPGVVAVHDRLAR